MPITALSSREFNQDSGRAKRAARKGPVIITDQGRASHVLLSIDEYERIVGNAGSIADALGLSEAAEIKFNPPGLSGEMHHNPWES